MFLHFCGGDGGRSLCPPPAEVSVDVPNVYLGVVFVECKVSDGEDGSPTPVVSSKGACSDGLDGMGLELKV